MATDLYDALKLQYDGWATETHTRNRLSSYSRFMERDVVGSDQSTWFEGENRTIKPGF